MSARETPLLIPCGAECMLGIVHAPQGDGAAEIGTVIVVGGPQYRVGGHRQYVIMARALCAAGVPVLRFDCRGMGDSEGRFRGFEHIGDDIRAAIDAFVAARPGLARVVLWGLCDAASANMLYGGTDARVAGMVLVNPWVRTEAGYARTHLRHYYLERLTSRDFWRKICRGEFRIGASLASFSGMVCGALGAVRAAEVPRPAAGEEMASLSESGLSDRGLPDRMRRGFETFRGPVLYLLSGADLTAREFEDAWKGSRRWRTAMRRAGVTVRAQQTADHTWSRRADLDEAVGIISDWIAGLRENRHTSRAE